MHAGYTLTQLTWTHRYGARLNWQYKSIFSYTCMEVYRKSGDLHKLKKSSHAV